MFPPVTQFLYEQSKGPIEEQTEQQMASPVTSSSSRVSGLRRNGTLKGRSMIKKVPCPIVPTSHGMASQQLDKMGPNTASCPSPRVSYRYSTVSSTSSTSSSDIAASDLVESWLSSIHFEEYAKHFILNGYDLATASRMSPEDLIAIGITNPVHRKKIKMEINALNVPDGIPTMASNLYDWLYKLRLEEYYDLLCHQSYDSIEKVTSLTWEDFEEIGIKKLGHQKRLDLAIKKMNQEQKKHSQAPVPSSSSSNAISVSSNASYLVSQPHYASTSTINCYPGSGASPSVSFPDLSRCPMGDSFRPVVLVSSQPPNISHGMSVQQQQQQLTQQQLQQLQQHPHYQLHQDALVGLGSASSSNMELLSQRCKTRPVAMIQAKTRPASTGPNPGYPNYPDYSGSSYCNSEKDPDSISNCTEVSSVSSVSSLNSARHSYAPMSDVASIYATLKRQKKPPPPPKRTNSVTSNSAPICVSNQFTNWSQVPKVVPQPLAINKSSSSSSSSSTAAAFMANGNNRSFSDAFQEVAFATCVKSLTSQFSSMSHNYNDDEIDNTTFNNKVANNNSKVSIISSDSKFGGSDEFPPPPTPLRQSTEDISSNSTASENQCSSIKSPISSSSSNESLPFANDNVGTIRQSASTNLQGPMTEGYINTTGSQHLAFNASTNANGANGRPIGKTTNNSSPSSSYSSEKTITNVNPNLTSRQNSVQSTNTANVMDDIEFMLENLSNQLDAMLDNEVKT